MTDEDLERKYGDDQAQKNKEKEEQRKRRQSLPAKFVYNQVESIRRELDALSNVLTPAEEHALMRELDLIQSPQAPRVENRVMPSIQSELFPIKLEFEEKGSVALAQLEEILRKKRLSEKARAKLKTTVKKILILKKMIQIKQHHEEQMIANETDKQANMPKPKKEVKEREVKEAPKKATQPEEEDEEEPETKALPSMIDNLGLKEQDKIRAKKTILTRIATFTENERVLLANLFDKIEQYKRPVKEGGYGASTFSLDSADTKHMSRNIGSFLTKFNVLSLQAKLQTLSNELHDIKGGSVAKKIGINKLMKLLAPVISEMYPNAIYTDEGDVQMKERGKAGRPKKKKEDKPKKKMLDKKAKKPSDE